MHVGQCLKQMKACSHSTPSELNQECAKVNSLNPYNSLLTPFHVIVHIRACIRIKK